jgi:hypothetical protein
MNVVCRGFDKFFNYGEGNAATIDWSTAQVQEKIDGSLIKVWGYKGEWKVSTNGCIDAEKAKLNDNSEDNFRDLFLDALIFCFINKDLNSKNVFNLKDESVKYLFNKLNPEYTYLFELISPHNKVVIPYKETKVYHIGTRHNKTGEEINVNIGIEKPKKYSLYTFNACLQKVKQMPYDKEGYVIVDKDYNRIKIKSPAYVAVHHLKSSFSENNLLTIIRNGESEEFLNYLPEYKKEHEEMNTYYNKIINKLYKDFDYMKTLEFKNKKDFALTFAKDTLFPVIFFALWDKKINNVMEGLNSLSNKIILDKINKLKGENK